MARKAGQVRLGEEAASQAVLDHKARLILVAADAGETTARRLKRLESDKLPVLTLPEKKSELGAAVGFVDVAAAAVWLCVCHCPEAGGRGRELPGCGGAPESPPVQSRAPEGGYCQARQEIGQTRQMSARLSRRRTRRKTGKKRFTENRIPFVPMGKHRRFSHLRFPIGTSPESQEVAILYEY